MGHFHSHGRRESKFSVVFRRRFVLSMSSHYAWPSCVFGMRGNGLLGSFFTEMSKKSAKNGSGWHAWAIGNCLAWQCWESAHEPSITSFQNALTFSSHFCCSRVIHARNHCQRPFLQRWQSGGRRKRKPMEKWPPKRPAQFLASDTLVEKQDSARVTKDVTHVSAVAFASNLWEKRKLWVCRWGLKSRRGQTFAPNKLHHAPLYFGGTRHSSTVFYDTVSLSLTEIANNNTMHIYWDLIQCHEQYWAPFDVNYRAKGDTVWSVMKANIRVVSSLFQFGGAKGTYYIEGSSWKASSHGELLSRKGHDWSADTAGRQQSSLPSRRRDLSSGDKTQPSVGF